MRAPLNSSPPQPAARGSPLQGGPSAGDYAVHSPEGKIIASVERKSLENLCSTLSDGTLSFQVQRLSEIPHAAVVVEGRYSGLLGQTHVSGAWLAEVLSRLEV